MQTEISLKRSASVRHVQHQLKADVDTMAKVCRPKFETTIHAMVPTECLWLIRPFFMCYG